MTPLGDPGEPLRSHALAKQYLGERLRALLAVLEGSGDRRRADSARELLAKLAEDRFHLAVLGEFKRGKSSLINAVVGREVLPTGVLPLTSAITALRYGPRDRVTLRFKARMLPEEVPLGRLAEYTTEQGNPGNQKGLRLAEVELPAPFLRRGLFFIDTPGIGSSRQENTATTYEFLPEADAVLFVTSVEAPLTRNEEEFLLHMRRSVRKFFVIVNKIDLLSESDCREVVGYVRREVCRILESGDIEVFPVSARQSLAGSAEERSRSGIEPLEARLASFLAGEKNRVFLRAIVDRALRLIAEEEANSRPGLPGMETRRKSLGRLNDSLGSVGQRLAAGKEPAPPEDLAFEGIQVALQPQPPQLKKAEELADRPTCPLCASQSNALFSFLARRQWELASDREANRAFVAAKGFCKEHSWHLAGLSSPRGVSEGLAPLVEATAALLHRTAADADSELTDLPQTATTRATCEVCRVLREAGTRRLEALVDSITSPEGREAYLRSHGVCLPHLNAILAAVPSRDVRLLLLEGQARRLEDLAEDMRNFVLRHAAARSEYGHSGEEQAWRRALVQLVGERDAIPLRRDPQA